MDLDDILNSKLSGLSPTQVWTVLEPFREQWGGHQRAARVVAWCIQAGGAPNDIDAAAATQQLSNAWPKDPYVLAGLATAIAFAQHSHSVNDAPMANVDLSRIVSQLLVALDSDPPVSPGPWAAAGAAMRREGVTMSERAIPLFNEALARDQNRADTWYNLGICLKECGRWAEALEANLTSRGLRTEVDRATEWNLGISAMAVGDAEAALDAWNALGLPVEVGPRGLPIFAGKMMMCKLELVQRTRPDRALSMADDSPGDAEVVWMRRIGPCHGEIVSATVGQLCADIGDVVLHDALACGTESFGDGELPIFPALTVIREGGWRTVSCVARAQTHLDFDPIDDALDPGQLHLFPGPEDGLLHGKIAIPPGVPLSDIGAKLQKALADHPKVKLNAPDLHTS